jgi:2-keto-4-pentenoate hydratase
VSKRHVPLGSSELDAAAALLVAAQRALRPRPALPKACTPTSALDAYAVQDRFVAKLGRPVGYKIGFTNPSLQRSLGIPSPVYGRLIEGRVLASPASLPSAKFAERVIETEFGVRMARPLPARSAPHSLEAVVDAVGALMPSFEIVDSRFEHWRKLTPFEAIADNVLHSHWVSGAERADFRALDLAALEVTTTVDGREVTRGGAANVMGSPLAALHWLANELAQQGRGLIAGDLVTTGCCTDIVLVDPGADVRADFGALGTVRVGFSA